MTDYPHDAMSLKQQSRLEEWPVALASAIGIVQHLHR